MAEEVTTTTSIITTTVIIIIITETIGEEVITEVGITPTEVITKANRQTTMFELLKTRKTRRHL